MSREYKGESATQRRMRMLAQGRFICGHERTPENSRQHGNGFACVQCAQAAQAMRDQLRAERDDQVRAYVMSGKSIDDAARHFGISRKMAIKATGSLDMIRRSALIRDPLYAQRALKIAAMEAGARVDQLKQDWRDKPLVYARWAYMTAMHRKGASLGRIGRILGRDHTTVHYGIKQAARLMDKPEFAALVAKVEAA